MNDDLKISQERNNLLLESCIKSNEKMSNTMDEVKDTLIILAESVNQNNKIVTELAINVKALNNKIYNNKKIYNKSNQIYKSNIFDSIKRTYKAILLSIYQ